MNIYSFHRLNPLEDGRVEKNRAGRVMLTPEGAVHLEDYHGGMLRRAMPAKDPGGAQEGFDELNSSPYIGVSPWDELAGDRHPSEIPEFALDQPYVPEQSGPPAQRPSVFEYLRAGMDKPHIVEFSGGRAMLDGAQLADDESRKMLANVRAGTATLRYHAPAPVAPAPLQKAESAPAKPAALDKDLMLPKLGNLLGLAQRTPGGKETVVACDLNDFWKANEIGWREADEAILAFGELIGKSEGGEAFRDGGDGFVVFFSDRDDAAHYVRTLFEQLHKLPPVGGTFRMTLSVGMGSSQEEAARALQVAKRNKYHDGLSEPHDSFYAFGGEAHVVL